MLSRSDTDSDDNESLLPGCVTTATLSCHPRKMTLVPCLRDHGSTKPEKCHLGSRFEVLPRQPVQHGYARETGTHPADTHAYARETVTYAADTHAYWEETGT